MGKQEKRSVLGKFKSICFQATGGCVVWKQSRVYSILSASFSCLCVDPVRSRQNCGSFTCRRTADTVSRMSGCYLPSIMAQSGRQAYSALEHLEGGITLQHAALSEG